MTNDTHQTDIQDLLTRADAAIDEERYEEAKQLCNQVLALDTECFEARYFLYYLLEYHEQGANTDEHRGWLLENTKDDPSRIRARCHALRGEARIALKDTNITALKHAIALMNEALALAEYDSNAGFLEQTYTALLARLAWIELQSPDTQDQAIALIYHLILRQLDQSFMWAKEIDPLENQIIETCDAYIEHILNAPELPALPTGLTHLKPATPPRPESLGTLFQDVAGNNDPATHIRDYPDFWRTARRAKLATLIRLGANPHHIGSYDGASALHRVAASGDSNSIDFLLAHGLDINAQDKQGDTALIYAVKNTTADIIRLLIARGASADTRNKEGRTALHEASCSAGAEAVEVLCSAGCQVSAASNNGQTPLHLAARMGRTSTAEALLKAGADPLLRNAQDMSAIDEAKMQHNFALVRQLETHVGIQTELDDVQTELEDIPTYLYKIAQELGQQAALDMIDSGDHEHYQNENLDPASLCTEAWECVYSRMMQSAIDALPEQFVATANPEAISLARLYEEYKSHYDLNIRKA